jgi:autotransporter-associated beta strand protein
MSTNITSAIGTVAPFGAQPNVRLTANDNSAGLINSLTLSGSGISAGAGTLRVISGGVLSVNSSGPYTNGSNTINATTLAIGAEFGAREAIIHTVNNLTVNSAVTSNVGLTKAGPGTLTLNGANNWTGATYVNGGKIVLNSPLTTTSMNVMPTATAELGVGGSKTLVTQSLNIAGATNNWTGKVDVKNNDIVVRSTTATRVADRDRIHNQLKQGFNATGTKWTGNGIMSSLGGNGSSSYAAIGVAVNDYALLGGVKTGPLYTSFSGQTVGTDDVLVKYTYFGDADLDGSVGTGDYFLIDNGFANNRTGWINGDFDYDGTIGTGDYFLIDNAFLGQGAPLVPASAGSSALSGVTAVPEPTMISMFGGLAAAGLIRRRRRVVQ